MSSNSFLNLKRAGRNRFLNRSLALLLVLILLLALLPRLEIRAEAAYYDEAIQKLMGWNVMQGYPDGSLHEDSYITRAEFVALINRAYGYEETTAIPFTDVPDYAWYYDDISAAYAAGYFSGASTDTANPSGNLTREQAMVMLARNMRLSETAGEVTNFSDGRDFQSYSAGYANAAVAKGVISGYSDGSFHPAGNITRGEMAVMLSRALGNLVNEAGSYALGDVFGNVTINTTNVTLRDTTIAGDLYLTGGVGLGGVTLENVNVLGDIIVAGGGESDAGESVVLRNVTAENLIVDTLMGEYVSLRAEGNTDIARARLLSDAYLQDRTPAGLGFQTIRLEGAGGTYSLSGNLENIINTAPGSTLRLSQAIASNVTMDEAGVGASLWLDSSATVLNLSLDTATSVQGRGGIRKLNVNVAGTTVETLPDEIEVRPGLTGSIAGETMDSTAAAEASSEPHIQANYPRVINVSANSATATFSTNKSGTVYWAITSISDGSVDEESLLTPAAQSRILKSGSVAASQSNTVYSANITGLTPGGNYYLTAMLVDARGDYSPIKIVSFTTTDNTTPAFGSGFPHLVEIEDTYAYAAVMATKDCQLYWVVFDKGSSAPTAASFRSGAFSNAYGFGVMDVERNISTTFQINNLKMLKELDSYDVYFWLNDANSAKSSAVKKLSFTTVDRTPPRFNQEPIVTNIAKTSLRLTTNVNEAGTVYWVIVESGEEYPKQPTTSILERYEDKQEAFEEYFKLQIANGMNGLKAGSVRVSADKDATINITGLQPETQYKIYYLAKDNAGNYSEITVQERTSSTTNETYYVLDSNYIWASTLDDNAPTVDQEFTRGSAPRPYADTSIRIVFSERVQYHDSVDNAYYKPLDEAYEAYREYRSAADPTEAQQQSAQEYLDILHKIIKLYSSNGSQVKERTWDAVTNDSNDWIIDYRNATVAMEGRNMVVTFPTIIDEATEKPTAASALNLNSDATYYFVIDCIADTAADPNDMNDRRPVQLDPFTTLAAQAILKGENLSPRQVGVNGVADPVEVDTVFSMTPISVSRADPTKSWDMLIWADRNVTFDLYTRKAADNGQPMPTSGWEKVGAVENNKNPVNSKIIIDTQYPAGSYIGLSYWRDLKGSGYNPYVRDDAITESQHQEGYYGLEDGQIYYFAIKLTNIEDTEPDNWTGSVNFWITVNTGDDESFETFETSGDKNEDRYDDFTNVQEKLSEISSSADGSGKFIRTASFADKAAPGFANGYPKLEATDTGLKASLQLERPGTVYWVVAPVNGDGKINTTRQFYSKAVSNGMDQLPRDPEYYDAGTPVGFNDYDVPIGDGAYYESSYALFSDTKAGLEGTDSTFNDQSTWYPLYLKSPTQSDIYGPNSSFLTNAYIKTGYIEANNVSVTPLEISGLLTNTEYFLYIVVKGTSTVYSDYAQLFQFKTEEAYRPGIELTANGTTGVDVRSHNMDAAVDYALFQLDLLYASLELNADFVSPDVMGTAGLEAYNQYLTDNGMDPDDNPIAKMTVYQAMLSGPTGSYDSYFDKFADASYKLKVRDIVISTNGGAAGTAYIGGTAGTPKPLEQYEKRNQLLGIDCAKEFPIKENVNYYILTVSRYANADPNELTGNSYSFRAYAPIYILNTDPPKLISITGAVTVDYTKTPSPTVAGNFVLLFDKNLYYYESNGNDSKRTPIHQSKEDSNGSYKAVTALSTLDGSTTDGTNVNGVGIGFVASGPEEQTTDRIILQMEENATSGNITFDAGKIASAYSQPIGEIYLSVDLKASDSGKSSHMADATLSYNVAGETIWQNGENIRINVTVESKEPTVQNVRISMSAPVLEADGSATATATVSFSDPIDNTNSHEVTWTSSDTKVAVVGTDTTYFPGDTATTSFSGNTASHTIRIHAVGPGQTTITATCGGISGSVTVTVRAAAPAFNQDGYVVKVGGTLDLGKELKVPDDMEVKSILWVSDQASVAGVSASQMGSTAGLIQGVSVGKATISATITPVSGKPVTVSIPVTVVNP